jgi:hypothetical protein
MSSKNSMSIYFFTIELKRIHLAEGSKEQQDIQLVLILFNLMDAPLAHSILLVVQILQPKFGKAESDIVCIQDGIVLEEEVCH